MASGNAGNSIAAWKAGCAGAPRQLFYVSGHCPAEHWQPQLEAAQQAGEPVLVLAERGANPSLPASLPPSLPTNCLSVEAAPQEWLRRELADPNYTRISVWLRRCHAQRLPADPRLTCHPVEAAVSLIHAADDLHAHAQALAACTFGQYGDLGQSVRAVRRAHIDERVFSRFTERLLAECESLLAAHLNEPRWDSRQTEFLERARKVGLDEGSTLLVDAPHGLLFTEVDPRTRIASQMRPAPLLCLLRVRSADARNFATVVQACEQRLAARAVHEDLCVGDC
jgi:hypothetical protein